MQKEINVSRCWYDHGAWNEVEDKQFVSATVCRLLEGDAEIIRREVELCHRSSLLLFALFNIDICVASFAALDKRVRRTGCKIVRNVGCFLFFYGDVVHKISASYLLSSRVTLLIFSPTGSSFNHHFPFDANGAAGRNARRKDTQARRRPFTDEFQPNPEKLVRYFQSTNEEIYSIKKTIWVAEERDYLCITPGAGNDENFRGVITSFFPFFFISRYSRSPISRMLRKWNDQHMDEFSMFSAVSF